jgi:hypothetical protein
MRFTANFSGGLSLALVLATVAGAGEPVVPSHGIIHFFEPKPSDRPPPDLKDPLTVGAEGIFWWGDLEPQEAQYDWARVDREIQRWQSAGKPLDVRLATAHNAPNMTPAWMFDRYHVRRIGRGHWCDAEETLGVYELGEGGQRTSNSAEVISGQVSIATRVTPDADAVVLRMAQPDVLAANLRYSIQFDYRSTTGATGWVALINPAAGFTNRVEFIAPPGQRGSFSLPVRAPDVPGSQILWGANGGQLSLDNINLMAIQPLPAVLDDDVEAGPRYWKLTDNAGLTRDPALVLSGHASILISNNAPGYVAAVMNDPATFPILQGQGYSAGFEFRALSSATIRLRLVSQAPPFDMLDEQVITLKAGDSGNQKWYYPAFVWREKTVLEIGLVGPGQVVIDDLRWSRWSDRVTCYPDYFNPVFREKWEQFITAFAARYAQHPGVGRISVGGFGRWEEVILDDDVPGLLDAQWLARGFTQEKYLQQITWSMDLYKRLFPDKPLRICLAYGLKKQNDPDLIYRRVAQAAVARGIGLKQNGLSEKYDAWDDVTSTSYLFNRYRFHPGISLTYETGGQISRVAKHFSQGHPLSVLNRGMIDGTDYLFLYGSDINARHVHKYLGYTSDLLGAPLLTTFYSRLGDFSLVMEHTPSPQEYRNQWLGLREFSTDGADPLLTFRNGEPCAATRQGLPHIVFDVDDRQQYHGMFGVVFTVEYLDEGWDEFEVNNYNNFTRRWEKLGHVRKTGTGAWKAVSFQKPDWCRSARGDGEDVHADLVINDLGDGIEHIAGVELSFVPAREWERELIQASEPAATHEPLHDTLAREIELPEGEPLNWIAVPVWSGGWERNGLRGRIVAMTDHGEVVASEKSYPMPADQDWFELPLTPVPGCRRYRIELTAPTGAVGWYRSADGNLAYRAWRYATLASKIPVATQSTPAQSANIFRAPQPFAGLQLSLPAISGNGEIVARLHRRLTGGEWSAPITEQSWSARHTLQTIHFEPQTAGEYKLEMSLRAGDLPKSLAARGGSLQVLELKRLLPPHPVRPFARAAGVTLFDSRKSDNFAKPRLEGLKVTSQKAGIASFEIQTARPAIELTPVQTLAPSPQDCLRFELANRSSAPLVRLYWAGAGQTFAANRSTLIPLVQNDTMLRGYEFPIGLEENWRVPVDRLRLEWLGNDTTSGVLELGKVSLVTGNPD